MAAGSPVLVEIQQDEVLTGEAVALDVQPLGLFLRALGALVDFVASVALFIGALALLNALSQTGALSELTVRTAVILVIVVIAVVIPTVVETASRGRSLGRLVVGGRIVRTDGGGSGFRQALIRATVGILEVYMSLGAVAFLVGVFTPRAQRLGDLVAGTYCERTRPPKLPAPGPGLPPGMEAWAAVADVGRLPDRLARRIAQFAREAPGMDPGARARLGSALAAEASRHVSPVPAVPPEVLLRSVAAVRRDRELQGLAHEGARVASLTAGLTGRRGLPER